MYDWVSEGSVRKYNRAIADLDKANVARRVAGIAEVEVTEEQVKGLYVKWGGLVIGDDTSVKGNDNPEMAMEVAKEESKARKSKKK